MVLQGNVFSSALARYTGLSVFFPDSLKKNEQSGKYRVVYLLHGLHGDNRQWLNNTMLSYFAKKGNTVFVMPEVGRSFYTDMKRGAPYFTYIAEELPELCRQSFNISAAREDTAVMGGSMGGYGALKIALSKPERYGFCAVFAPACLFLDETLKELRLHWKTAVQAGAEAAAVIGDLQSAFGEDFQYNAGDIILELAKNADSSPQKPKIHTSCGTDDDFLKDNRRFAEAMKQFSFDFAFEEMDGKHDWNYFNAALFKAFTQWSAAQP
jgi:S-formylglutathione hydrolase FrmB